jgi:ribonuclease HI
MISVTRIYTDGACSGNPGRGGWAFIISYPDGAGSMQKSGAFLTTTNNRMELWAVIKALEFVEIDNKCVVYSDSQYLVNSFTKGWIQSWQKSGWKTSSKKKVANKDLWQKILQLSQNRDIDYLWVRGHEGHIENEKCDKMAVSAIKELKPEIDEGYEKEEQCLGIITNL